LSVVFGKNFSRFLAVIIKIYTSILQNFTDSGIELGYEVYIIRFMTPVVVGYKIHILPSS